MMVMHAQSVEKVSQMTGYGGAGAFLGMTLTDIDVVIRIAVGVITCISLLVHLYFKVRAERRKQQ